MSKTKSSTKGTYEQKSQEVIDWMTDAAYMLAPLLKLALVSGMVYMNVMAGIALSNGDWVFPALCGALDLSLLWFWNKSKSDELTKGEQSACKSWSMYLLTLSMISGFVWACALDAKARIITDPYVAAVKNQMEAATDLFNGMEENTAEKAFGGDPIVALRETYLKEYKKKAVDIGYNPIHAAFYVVPGIKNNPETFMGALRLMFVFGIMGSGLGIAHYGAGVGRAQRLHVKAHRPGKQVVTDDVIEGEYTDLTSQGA